MASITDDVILVELAGEFDVASKEILRERLRPLLAAKCGVLDLSSVKYFDSVALAELIGCRRHMEDAGKSLVLVAIPTAPVRRLLNVSGLSKLFKIFDDVASARAYFRV